MKFKFDKTEPYIFYSVVLLNMLPVLLYKFFPTMDGAAHLYNSAIINELVTNSGTALSDIYSLNTIPIPNWIGHFMISLAKLILPAYLAEKMVLVAYLFLLPVSFRYLTKQFGNILHSYLIFPFCYTFLFYLGFYNLSIAFILLFFTLAYWLKTECQTIKQFVFFSLLITLTYFSHILIFCVLLMNVFLLVLQNFIKQIIAEKLNRKVIQHFIKKTVVIFGSSLPSLIFFFYFLFQVQFFTSEESLSVSELLKWIKDVRPIIAIDYEYELRFTEAFYHLLIGLITIIIFIDIQKDKDNYVLKKIIKILIEKICFPKNIFLISALIILIFYFTIANSSNAGMMSDRFCLVFFILMIVWISVNTFPQWIKKISIILILIINFGLVHRYVKATKNLSSDAKSIYYISKYIQPYSSVLPICNTNNWLQPHFSNYLGADNPIIILENYEANVKWFPVRWKNDYIPEISNLSQDSTEITFRYIKNKTSLTKKIDYIFIWGNDDKISEKIKSVISKFYTPVIQSDNGYAKLYRLKKSNLYLSYLK